MSRAGWLAISAAAFVGLSTLAIDVPAGALTQAQLKGKALALSNMPTGWSVDNAASGGGSGYSGCLAKLEAQQNSQDKGVVRVKVNFIDGNSPALSETLVSGANGPARYREFISVMNGCKQVGLDDNGTHITGSAGAMSFPTIGNASKAYAFNFSVKGFNIGLDLVVFKVGNIAGDITYEDLGKPDTSSVQAFATAAANKVAGKPVTTPTDAF